MPSPWKNVLKQAVALEETMYSVKATSASRTVREIASDLVQQIPETAGPTSELYTRVSNILEQMNNNDNNTNNNQILLEHQSITAHVCCLWRFTCKKLLPWIG